MWYNYGCKGGGVLARFYLTPVHTIICSYILIAFKTSELVLL